jgi:CBS domain-containing protein
VGVVTAQALGRIILDNIDLGEPVQPEDCGPIRSYDSAANALRELARSGAVALPVTDAHGHLLGVVGYADFVPRPFIRPQLPLVGGMATPAGVYLTTGSASGGASKLALVGTGLCMFTFLIIGNYVGSWLVRDAFGDVIPASWQTALAEAIALMLFLSALRISPLAGIHGAEHKVVHALEREEPLSVEVVRRMPRIHPRCGTNLAAGMMLFLTIFRTPWIPNAEARLLVAIFATLLLWKWVGSQLQRWVTTREPSDKQIARAIESANDLLKNVASVRSIRPNPFQRIWNMGILQVVAGSLIGAGILVALAPLLKIDVRL